MTLAMLGGGGRFGGFRDTPKSDILYTRDDGVWARQVGPAVNGTSFIECHTGEADVPRMTWIANKWLLAIGAARTNLLQWSNFRDDDVNGIPDGWSGGNGAALTDYTCAQSGGPHGGAYWIRENTGTVGGVEDDCAIADDTPYTFSAWVRAPVALTPGKTLTVFSAGGGVYPAIALTSGAAFDWVLVSITATTTDASAASNGFFQVSANPGGQVWVALPTFEAGEYPSLCPVPSAGGLVTKPLERLRLPAAAIGRTSGRVRLGSVCPAYADDSFARVHRIASLSMLDYVCYDGSDDTFRVYNGGVMRAQSNPQTFARLSEHTIDFFYGADGTRLVIDGAVATDPTPWTQIGTLAGAIGGASDGTLTEEAAYGEIEIWNAA